MATLLDRKYTYYVVSGTNTPAGTDNRYFFEIYLDSQSVSENKSYLHIDGYVQIVGDVGALPTIHLSNQINGAWTSTKSTSVSTTGVYYVGTWNFEINHNNEGVGSFSYLGRGYINGIYTYTSTSTYTLPTIPRSPTYNSINASNITLNSVRLTASIDTKGLSVTGGGWDLSTDGGATWTYYSGDPLDKTITGLQPGTLYWYRGYVTTSGGGANSWWGTFTTTQQATITNSNVDFDIDNGIVLTFTNPSGKDVDLFLESPNGTIRVTRENITSPYTLSLTTEEKNTLFGLAPTSNTLAFRFKLRTDNNDGYISYKSGTASISNANPTFTNFTYQDINSVTLALTGNNQTIIKGYSTLRAIISTSNKAVAQKGATMDKYRLVVGSKQIDVDYSDSSDVNLELENIDNNVFTVYAIDSRGNSTAKQISPSTYIDYFEPYITSPIPTATRTNGIDSETTLSFSGKFFNDSFGAVNNSLTITYEYKKTSESTWTTGTTTITPTINGNIFSFSGLIAGDLGANGFDQQYSYNIRLIVTDEITSITYDGIILGTGKPNLAIHREGVAINQPYDENLGGALQVNGEIIGADGGYITRRRKNLTATGNFNDCLTQGTHYVAGNNIPNAPRTGNIYGKLIVEVNDNFTHNNTNNWIWQTLYTTNREIFFRGKVNAENWTVWERIYKEYILYDNPSGTTGTVILNEPASNFTYLQIFYRTNNNSYDCVTIYDPNGKGVNLTSGNFWGSSVYIHTTVYNILGNSLSVAMTGEGELRNNSIGFAYQGSFIWVHRVVGYR